jgi:hypothetical protein
MQDQPHATLRHWRAFGAAEWRHVRDGLIGLALGSLVPVALFYAAFRGWGFSVAVVLVLTWSAAVFAYLVADTVAGWPINISLAASTTWFPLRQLQRAGLIGVVPSPSLALLVDKRRV